MASGDMFDPLETLGPIAPRAAASLIGAHRRRFLVPVRQPLVLVTQIQRSGGTLVTQLFDGHPGLHVHPSELHIGKPKWTWPSFSPDSPAAELYLQLREAPVLKHGKSGYQKLSPAEIATNPDHRELVLPFIFFEPLQRELFEKDLARQPAPTRRSVLDAYVTSYFNAWLDYGGLYRDPATVKYWMAFIPRFLADPNNVTAFFSDYPDGRMIVPIRDPVSWYASARAHEDQYADLDAALSLWLTCNNNALDAAEAAPERFLFVRLEGLIAKTRRNLRRITEFLGVDEHPATLQPTFNGMPVVSDSSFGSVTGIDPTALDRSDRVNDEAQARIRSRTRKVYARMLARAAE